MVYEYLKSPKSSNLYNIADDISVHITSEIISKILGIECLSTSIYPDNITMSFSEFIEDIETLQLQKVRKCIIIINKNGIIHIKISVNSPFFYSCDSIKDQIYISLSTYYLLSH